MTTLSPLWSPAEDEALRKAWGRRSASLIGCDLARSKSAVIARAHRLKLPLTTSRSLRERQTRVLRGPSKLRAPRVDVAPVAPPQPVVSLHSRCQWPEGDQLPYRFCGDPVEVRGKRIMPYCPCHAAQAYVVRERAS